MFVPVALPFFFLTSRGFACDFFHHGDRHGTPGQCLISLLRDYPLVAYIGKASPHPETSLFFPHQRLIPATTVA